MRGFMAALEQTGDLHRVSRKVALKHEISAVLSLRNSGPAQLFTNVEDATMPVVGNILNSRDRFARVFGTTSADLDAYCLAALDRQIAPVIVKNAPVQEVVHSDDIELARLLPVPTWFARERGPYITAAAIVAKDPETGRRNLSIARLRLEGGGRMMAGIAKNHHLSVLAQKAQALGRPLEIAAVIGNHAAVLLASQMYLGLGDDEYDVAGGLLGEPLELVKCKTVDLEVPAHAEIVLEGTLHADELIEEGPVSEFHGFYVDYRPGTGVNIRCVTHRRDAIYQAILPGFASEHCLLGAIAIASTVCQALQRVIPAVKRVVVTEGGLGRLHCIISMHRPLLGEAKRAVLLAMGTVNLLKLVIVVDDDVDPEDWRMVEWSLATRFRGHEDLIVLPGVKADRCDPLHENLVVTKVGMIATTRPGDGEQGTRSELVAPPADLYARVRRELDQY